MSKSSSTNGTGRGSASLSTAVSSLVRAQYGLKSLESSSAAGDSSTDLDKHVAELLLQEAREREARAKASNSSTAWSFSDEEDGSKSYTSRTNKRFLKNMLRGVEEHNAPLRRKEDATRESLDDIRRREREARERRLGLKDAERAGRSDATASTSTSSTAIGDRRAAGPGFAARMLASGLSGALASREEKTREGKGVKAAVDEARSRAERHRDREFSSSYVNDEKDREDRINYKGKEREETCDNEDKYSSRRRSRSSDQDETRHRSSRHRSRRDYSPDGSQDERRESRHRERSRSPSIAKRHVDDDVPERRRRDRDTREDSYQSKDDRRIRDRSRSQSSERDRERRKKRSRRRSSSSVSHSPSERDSDASSDTFIDYTGATDAVQAPEGGSKMDKYFSSNYNPALDISVADLEDPKTGLIGEGNFSEWDKMLHTLKRRKEDKLTGVTQAREEERERQLRKMERKRRKEERELRHALKKEKKRKKRRRSTSDSGSDSDRSIRRRESSSRKDRKRSKEPSTVVIDGFEYGKRGSTRAWDLGKG